MYYQYFGLQEEPFSIAPNPRYLYMSARHKEALAHLLYGVGVGGGFVLLTGEVGTGKTTVSRCLLNQLPENTDVAFILNPYLNATELLATICDELGIKDIQNKESLKHLTECLSRFLLENHAKGRNTILLIDEAQHLQFEALEQIRLLTNLETNTKKLLQIIFVGQPELQTLLAKPSLRQLAQRITARFHIHPLNLAETHGYILHRLQVAGLPANQNLFSSPTIKQVYKISGGIPRLINVLCDRALLGTYAQNKSKVDRATLKQAALEVLGDKKSIYAEKPFTKKYLLLSFVALGFLLAGVFILLANERILTDDALLNRGILSQKTIEQRQEQPAPASVPQAPPAQLTVPLVVDRAPQSELSKEALEEPQVISPSWFESEEQAMNEILRSAELVEKGTNKPCFHIRTIGLSCETLAVENWFEFRQFNRPAVLILNTVSKETVFAALVAINETYASISVNGQISRMPLAELGSLWSGEFIIFWQAPVDFERPVALGDRGKIVEWTAKQFSTIDAQDSVLAGEKFNDALLARVKLFQIENGLVDDGIIGMKTLLKLNEKLGIAKITLDGWNVVQSPVNGKG